MFTLAIEDAVEVSVKFTLKNNAVNKTFSFTLYAKRMSQDDITDMLEAKDRKLKDILLEVVTGWSGQRLVLGDNKEPAEFGPEALDALLSVAGVATVCFNAYFRDCGAKEKN